MNRYQELWEKLGVTGQVINLKERKDRALSSLKNAETLGLPIEIFSVDRHPDGGEAGCFDSHQRVCRKALQNGQKYGLIFEDDVEVNEDFIDRVNEILEKLEEKDISFSVLHLFNGNWMKTISEQKKVLKINDDIEILKETINYNAAASAYIMSKEYAEFLIERFFPIKDPNDIFVGSFPKHGNHLTLKMTYDKKEKCYKSPILGLPCGGEGGTGADTTQVYDAPTMKEKSCRKC
jgi:GR25 family glycosyltransferase involved in LPS biosynthesis